MNIQEKGEITLNDQRPSIGFHQWDSVAAMDETGQPACFIAQRMRKRNNGGIRRNLHPGTLNDKVRLKY